MREELFVNTTIDFSMEKVGGTDLSDYPGKWPQQILQDAYKQHPELGDYKLTVILDKINEEKGTGLGFIRLETKPNIPPQGATIPREMEGRMDTEPSESRGPDVGVPIIIKDSKMAPLDIIRIGSRFYPFSAERLAEAMFRPDTFEMRADSSSFDKSIYSMMRPPNRFDYSFGFIGKQSSISPKTIHTVSMVKEAADRSLLPSDVDRFRKVVSEPLVMLGFDKHGHLPLVQAILQASGKPSVEMSKKAAISIKPDVLQIVKLGHNRYKVKYASASNYSQDQIFVGRPEAVELVGENLVKCADIGENSPIQVKSPVELSTLVGSADRINSLGTYVVRTVDQRKLVGVVFSKVVDFNMNIIPLMIFTNGSECAIQDNIAGVRLGGNTRNAIEDLSTYSPSGFGVFVGAPEKDYSDDVPVLSPVDIIGTSVVNNQVVFSAKNMLGVTLEIMPAPGVVRVEHLEGDRYAIPDTMRFVPIGKPVALVESSEIFNKESSIHKIQNQVMVKSTGEDSFSLSGDPINAIPLEDRTFVKKAEAEFILGLAGFSPEHSGIGLDSATKTRTDVIFEDASRTVTTYEDRLSKTASMIQPLVEEICGLRRDLIKEAATIPDDASVDSILALNFITPDNIDVFVQQLPQLRMVESRLAEMLLGSRLGVTDIPEQATKRAMDNLEEVVKGIHLLEFKNKPILG